jgi:hypothetical protein
MQINTSSRFNHSQNKFHDSFNINATDQQILSNKNKVVNMAIESLKKKCKNYFKVEFGDMVFFEVYFFNREGKEIEIFKKEKE